MKNLLFIFTALSVVVLASCKSAQQRETAARENVSNAKENVVDANQNLKDTQEANNQEWEAFKLDANAKILSNEERIADLKVKMNKPGNTFDGIYKTRIEKLEAKNVTLKSNLNNYDGNRTGWQTFKTDFNRDMKEVGDNIKDLFR